MGARADTTQPGAGPATDASAGTLAGVTVPVAVAGLTGADELVAECLVPVGNRVEVALDLVAERHGAAGAELLAGYYLDAHRFWRRRELGHVEAGVFVRRRLAEWRQGTGRDKSDLLDQYHALLDVNARVAAGVEALLEPHPEGRRQEVFELHATTYPTALGGVAGPGELRRLVVVEARYAAWRDRRVRRLGAVAVDVDELWPLVPAGVTDWWAERR